MDTKLSSLVIALAVASMALTPLIMIQNAHAATSYCSDQTSKPHAWVTGCKDGWYDHDHCLSTHQDQVTMLKDIKWLVKG